MYFGNLASSIAEIIRQNTSVDIVKEVVVGDFTLLPAIHDTSFEEYFPCVLVEPKELEIAYDNKSLDTQTHDYSFDIYYIYPFYWNNSNVSEGSMNNIRAVINSLMNNRTLNDFNLDRDENEVGFIVIDSQIQKVSFDNEVHQFFLNLEIPLNVSLIEFNVTIKTLRTNTN